MKTIPHCLECGQPLSRGVYIFSQRIYGHSLCMKDQFLIEESGATAHTIDLYLALKSRNFPLVLQYFDGYKHVDMAIPGRLYIEVNGPFHQADWETETDLTHSVYSLEKKIPTIIITNALLENPRSFAHVVEELSKACRLMLKPANDFSMVFGPAFTAARLQ
jgi:hypothetical protein